MSLLGPQGLRRVALACHAQTRTLAKAVTAIPGVEVVFPEPYFHEVVLRLPVPVAPVLADLQAQGIAAGVPLEPWYPDLADCLLTCATETKTDADVDHFARRLRAAVLAQGGE
jgi:glycine dehydrogenase subunit 1